MDKYQQENNEHVIACIIERQGSYSAYCITPSMLDDKIPPVYISGYDSVAQVREAISEKCLEWKFDDFVGFDDFWRVVDEAGITKPDAMPHREQQDLLLEGRV